MTPSKHAWQKRAEDMARFTLDHLVARTDGFGRAKNGLWKTVKTVLQMQDLIGHFKGEFAIGIHPLGTDDRVRFLAIDVDAHDGDELRAKAQADAVRQRLVELGLAFLEEDSDGRGGRHFWIFLEAPLEADETIRLRELIQSDIDKSIEVFPKGDLQLGEGFPGGFIRLPGQHHKRSHFSRFIIDGQFVVGHEAVKAWINPPINSRDAVSRLVTEEDRSGQKTQKGQKKTEDTEACRSEQKGLKQAEACRSVQKTAEDSEDLTSHDFCHASKSLESAAAIIVAATSRVEEAIQATAPSGEGQRNASLFRLAQILRGIPEFERIPVIAIKPIVQRWHAAYLSLIGTQPFDESWSDFCRAWPRVEHPSDLHRLESAFGDPLHPSAKRICDANEYDSTATRRLISACLRLAEAHEDGELFLACRTVGKHLGITHRVAADLLNMLVTDGVLVLVSRGGPPKQASRYRIHPAWKLALEARND